MATLNLAIRFLAELAGIVAVGYAGFAVAASLPVRAAAGIGAALLMLTSNRVFEVLVPLLNRLCDIAVRLR